VIDRLHFLFLPAPSQEPIGKVKSDLAHRNDAAAKGFPSAKPGRRHVAWLVEVTGKQYRLLSEAEWEYCACGGANTRSSWGDEPGAGNANCNGCGTQWDLEQTAPAGWFKPNAFGLYDMHGNVWEWVEDSWHENYVGAPTNGAWLQGGQPVFRVIRGGSWRNGSDLLRAAVRERRNINVRLDTLGFRVARTMEP
jgi:formylglycine-generating enzyme required for sulfatase activity